VRAIIARRRSTRFRRFEPNRRLHGAAGPDVPDLFGTLRVFRFGFPD
jgi:hypothetical protein